MAIATQNMNPLTGRWHVLAGVALLHVCLLAWATTVTSSPDVNRSIASTLQARVITAPLPTVAEPPKPPPRVASTPTVKRRPTLRQPARRSTVPPPVVQPGLKPEKILSAKTPEATEAPAPSHATPGPVAPLPLEPARFDADYLDNSAPAYPAFSRRRHEQGRVLLLVTVNPDGSAARVHLQASSGHEALDESALATVARWRFIPARQGDAPVISDVLVPITFTLK